MPPRGGIDNFRRTAQEFRRAQAVYRTAHWVLGIVAIVLAGLVAAKLPGISDGCYRFIAMFSGIFTAIIAFASPKPNADRYRAARDILEDMIGRYDIDTTYTYDRVSEAAEEGRKTISGAAQRRTRS